MRLLISIVFCLITTLAVAQKDFVIEEIDGQKYYVHTVEKGNTLYGVSKLYGVGIQLITDSNPSALEGLSLGQILRIPCEKEPDPNKWTNPVRLEGEYLIHRVQRGETLFGIAKAYKSDVNQILELNAAANGGINPRDELRIRKNDVDEVTLKEGPIELPPANLYKIKPGDTLYSLTKQYGFSEEELKAANGGLPDGLKAGEFISFPGLVVKSVFETIDYEYEAADLEPIKDVYNIKMMLPFYLDTAVHMRPGSKEERLRNIAMEFYRGAMIAADTLEKKGLRSRIEVLDVNDFEWQNQLVDHNTQTDHLVIGPFQRKQFERTVDQYGAKSSTHFVCPVPQSNKILLKGSNVSKALASPLSQSEVLGKHLAQKHYMDNVILINSREGRDVANVSSIRKAFNAEVSSNPMAAMGQIKEISAIGKFVGDVQAELNPAFRNVFVLPAKDHSLIQDLLTKLAIIEDEEYEIFVVGTADWAHMDFIDLDYRGQFSISFPTTGFTDYSNLAVVNFVNEYRERYNSEPGEFAFIGHDVLLYYGLGLAQFGVNFPSHFDEIPQDGVLHLVYDFSKTGPNSGFENQHADVVIHDNYELKLDEYKEGERSR